jgi:hypothetical protein
VGSQNQRAQWGPADWSLHWRRQRPKTWSAVLVSFSNPLQRQCVIGVHMLQRQNFVGHARHCFLSLILLLRERVPSIAFMEFNETLSLRLLVCDAEVVVNF